MSKLMINWCDSDNVTQSMRAFIPFIQDIVRHLNRMTAKESQEKFKDCTQTYTVHFSPLSQYVDLFRMI